jgi:ADP-ribose pyrophosphatase
VSEPLNDLHLTEIEVSSSEVYSGSFLHVRRDEVRLPDGAVVAREYIVHPGAVMIVPMLPDGSVVVERQFRYPLRRVFLEFPAGKLEGDEPPLDCAQRELAEETGYTASEWLHLGTIHNAIAYSDEHIELYLARGLTPGQSRLDAGEFLDVHTMPLPAVIDAIYKGEVTDVKTIIGAYWVERFLAKAS